MKEGDKVAIATEVTAVHPEWVAVRVTFGRMVQNIRVDKALVRPLEERGSGVWVDGEAKGRKKV
jgi:hypothetical protein